jgi:hypothetical protein
MHVLPDRYTTDTSYKQFEQMRISLEPLTYQYGVDLFFYGEHSSTQASMHACKVL